LRPSARSGFTLLELLTVLVIIVVLAVLGVGMFDQIRTRSERVNCTSNLRNLYTGFQSYIVQYGHWPQNPHKLADKDHDGWWIDELQKVGLGEKSWLCPTHVRFSKAAAREAGKVVDDSNKKKRDREIHYMPTPFDANQATPRRWPTQPWLVETGNFHGDGPLFIFPDGTVISFGQFIRQGR
jgi:prepilin-type N-terminal cleavage/methylation domain-containing protein